MCACSEKEAGGGKTRSSWSTESMLVLGVDTRPLMLACKVDLQVFLSVPVYHKTDSIAKFLIGDSGHCRLPIANLPILVC